MKKPESLSPDPLIPVSHMRESESESESERERERRHMLCTALGAAWLLFRIMLSSIKCLGLGQAAGASPHDSGALKNSVRVWCSFAQLVLQCFSGRPKPSEKGVGDG